jgi:hypothetical protein
LLGVADERLRRIEHDASSQPRRDRGRPAQVTTIRRQEATRHNVHEHRHVTGREAAR